MAMELKPIAKQNVVDVVIQSLLDQMISGSLKSGEKLPGENDLSKQLGVGRNSVREALKVLQTLGILERHQGDGSYVAESYQMPFDWMLFPLITKIGNSDNLVELRLAIELGMIELIIDKITDDDLNKFEQNIEQFTGLTEAVKRNIDQLVELDVNFHLAIAELTENPALIEIARLIMKLYEPSMKRHLLSPEGPGHAIRDHNNFVEALRARDRKMLRRNLIVAFEHWQEYIDLKSKG